jgi:hypothetical protein
VAAAEGGGGPEREQHEADVVDDGEVGGVHRSAGAGRRSLALPRKRRGVGSGGAGESGWNTRTRGRDEASAGAGKVICDGDRGVSEKLLSIGPCRMARADT